MPGFVVVSTKDSDFKAVNRLLMYIRDWEFDDGKNVFKVIHKIDEASSARRERSDQATIPPMTDFSDNEWQGLSIDQVEQHMIAQFDESSGNTSLFFLLDDKGVQDQTVIVAQRVTKFPEDSDEPVEHPEAFDKVRMPWIAALSMWANLDISNMDFQDFCEEDYDEDISADRWWTFQDIMGEGYYDEYTAMAEDAIAELKKHGQA